MSAECHGLKKCPFDVPICTWPNRRWTRTSVMVPDIGERVLVFDGDKIYTLTYDQKRAPWLFCGRQIVAWRPLDDLTEDAKDSIKP